MRRALPAGLLLGLCATGAMAAQPAGNARPADEVDMELLEFLGSIDSEEEGWQEYLEQKPVKPVARAPEKGTPVAGKTDPKQVKTK